MTLDLSPAPAAAPAWRRIVAHGLTEAGMLARNGEQLLLALVIPVALLFAGRYFGERFNIPFNLFAPSVMALAIWSTGFTSIAITTAYERRYGVLERLAATPIGRFGVLAGKALCVLLIIAGQGLVLSGVALALGWRPHPTGPQTLIVALAVPLAVLTFASLALALSGTLRAEATLALANLVYLAAAAGGGLLVPLERHPAALQPVVAALPTAALSEAFRAWSAGSSAAWPLGVLAVWALLASLLAAKAFRWTS